MTKQSSLRRAALIGFGVSGIFLALVTLPTFFLDAMGKINFLPKLWTLLWQVYLSPATLLGDRSAINSALMFSSPDPRIALIPSLGVNFVFWGVLASVLTLVLFRLRNKA